MRVRRDGRTAVTVACALIGKYLDNLDAYLKSKELLLSIAEDEGRRLIGDEVTAAVNTADDSPPVLLADTGMSIASFGELADGELLVLTFANAVYWLQRGP